MLVSELKWLSTVVTDHRAQKRGLRNREYGRLGCKHPIIANRQKKRCLATSADHQEQWSGAEQTGRGALKLRVGVATVAAVRASIGVESGR